ncbi:PREDICTED: prolyl 4-hydroxylase subunit alpha-1-like [Papilio xuthus]|uniref:procollagen-proline 4-dioxygenase n=1 Tax=Papilio xuthus TaxID=66420 RepID=A0AAJ6ZPA8_PAPXU|nr:PREDICTED: prolyl 4-hydroxylase subunit alpha-1-like [Papilio xuthus]
MHHKPMLYVACIVLAMDWWAWTSAELFTAISDLEPLLETQKKIIDDLNDYVQKEEKRLGVLKKQINAYNREHEMAMADIDNYLGNPINAFTLIKRLTTDFNFIQNRIKLGTAFVGNETSNIINVRYPTDEDLTGAAQALTRLQNTYQLDIKELAQGRLNGIIYSGVSQPAVSTPLTASDCYELGRILYNVKDYKNSLRWMEESLVKYKEENEDYNFTEVDILEYISYLFYLLDDGQKALEWTTKLFSIDPNHQRALSNIPFYLKSVAEKKARLQNNNTEVMVEEETFLQKEKKVYEALCRGEMIVPSQISRKLKCSYLTKNHPFLKLAPIKREQIYIAPDVFVYHGVMSDEEIKCIKDMAKPRFKRATVRSANGGVMSADYRISKSAWLTDEESEVVARVSQRVADFTGLTMASAELLQVVNYGIGGHYDSHYDFTLKTDLPYESADGNRIATVLFYMSEVAQGGATVFTQLGLSVFPVKSSALVWLNLHPSGEGDLSTRHAACPVLRGSKWVSNKWIHESGQEFLAPCNLEYQREEVMRKIIKAKPRAKE